MKREMKKAITLILGMSVLSAALYVFATENMNSNVLAAGSSGPSGPEGGGHGIAYSFGPNGSGPGGGSGPEGGGHGIVMLTSGNDPGDPPCPPPPPGPEGGGHGGTKIAGGGPSNPGGPVPGSGGGPEGGGHGLVRQLDIFS